MFERQLQVLRDLFIPRAILEGLDDIIADELYRSGYRTFFLDVDNTLLTYEQTRVSLQRHQWVDMVRSMGFQVFLLSNNSDGRRIGKIGAQLGTQGLYFSMKPFAFCVRELAADMGVDLKTSVFVGDKLLMDVVAGNWVGAYTIWVDPLDKKDSFLRTVQRDLELAFLKFLRRIPA